MLYNYSQKLKDKIKEIYPNSIDINRHAERGNEILGRFLCDSMPSGLTVNEVLSASSLDELKQKAITIKNKQALYELWVQETRY